ncbi:MAG TPA: sigma-70 family RNA polymerase sigma factor [Acidobacteriaceae bacterium]|jgi:DNA-directed RNA polymerase specialized sigma24 family protein|nr:sigma-70 family RNA polymerase sigma factor [Acidobacteriaceae bacterium]
MAPRRLEEKQRDAWESHRHRVFSVSYYMTGSEIEAEELLRDTFISAFRRSDEPDQAVVDSALIDHLTARLPLDPSASMPLPVSTCGPSRRNILRVDLELAIRCLPLAERLVFLLMDVEGYPAQRIADLLQMRDPDVMRTAVMARMRLRHELALMHEVALMHEDGQQAA